MYNMQQLAEAERAVYVISNPDGSDAEFVPLKLDAETAKSVWQDLRARWAGRNLSRSGVAGLIHGVPVVMMKEDPSDFLLIVRLTAAFAQYVEDTAAMGSQETQPQPQPVPVGDSVAWCERLYALPDTRLN
jgi:hypothetical protein